MAEVSYATVTNRLHPLGRDALRKAFKEAQGAGHRHVELSHFIHHLLQNDGSDVALICDDFRLDRGRLMRDVQERIADLRPKQTESPVPSAVVMDVLEKGWTSATLEFGDTRVRSGHLILGALGSRDLTRELTAVSLEFRKIDANRLKDAFSSICARSAEGAERPADAIAAEPGSSPAATGSLAKFSQDLTAKAAAGEMDPVLGRDDEIRQVIDVLMRRRQNNPILTGEAGVGKTAVVEGFAQRVASGDVPPPLRGTKVHALDIGLMQAGASVKGEFEQRLRSVIYEVQSSSVPIILFIDEAHTLIGAGGAAGTGDAANLLKPALARGTLRTIAATTWAEYRQHIEKDPALTRRFQPIMVDEPDPATCCIMLRGLLGPMERHHKVRIADAAIVAAVQLSSRYIPARQLPDKAVSLLDTACARVAISQSTRPAALADLEADIAAHEAERAALEADRDLGASNDTRLDEIAEASAALRDKLAALEAEWAGEQAIVAEIATSREALKGDGAATARTALADGFAKLEAIEPDRRMIFPHVDEQAVAAVVADWTGIPVGRMVKNEIETILTLADTLDKRVVGQRHGLEMIARRIETSRAKLDNPQKPIGVFMLCGPSGVGKTETALALAEALYGGEQNMITINMSEFQEAHTVSSLKGAPPGYVGYGEGGRLTEAVRRKPYSVILLDEVEKAHPDVHEVFFQVFDKGIMEDGTGRRIDFKNTLIILTSNVGTDTIMRLGAQPQYQADPEALATALRPDLLEVFPPALLGRIVTIPYFPLSRAMLAGIVRLQLDRIGKRVKENHGAAFRYDEALVDHIVERCNDPDAGGRMVDRIVTGELLPVVAKHVLTSLYQGARPFTISIGLNADHEPICNLD